MIKTAIVVTVGSSKESLGAMKLAKWLRRLGWEVKEATSVDPFIDRFDLYAFSAVFSWKLPELVRMASEAKAFGEVWIGGPAVTFHDRNAKYVEEATGVKPMRGIDERFEREPGDYPMVYFSRGCPAYTPACGNCPVPKIEGNSFRYYRDAKPAKMLLDNNLSALPSEYQENIIERYAKQWSGGRVDCNSGFEPHSFNEATYERWKNFPLVVWRFGYDDITERDQALEMLRLLKSKGVSGRKIRVYTMIGNEPFDVCVKRIREVIAHGAEPWPQRLRPLDWIGAEKTLPVKFGWTQQDLVAVQRFYSLPQIWRTTEPDDFFYQSRFPFKDIKKRLEE